MAVTYASDEAVAPPQMGAGGAPRLGEPEGRTLAEKMAGVAAGAVKGAGYVRGGKPLNDTDNGAEVFSKAHDVTTLTKAAVSRGTMDSDSVLSGFSPDFTRDPRFAAMAYRLAQDSQVRKAFTATNQGLAGVPYGLVPSVGGFAE